MSALSSLTPEVMALLKGSDSPIALLHRMTLLGMVTPQEKQDTIASFSKCLEFAKRYFEYRENPDRVVFICANKDEQDRMLEGEARLGGIPFSMLASEAVAMYERE